MPLSALQQNPSTLVCHNEQLGQLYSHHHGWLRGWLRKRVGCHEIAADLAQDTFVRLLSNPKYLKDLSSAKRYLCTVANGLCIDMWRKKSVEQAWLETLASRSDDLELSPEDQSIILETLCEIDGMLGRLPINVANAFIWSQIDGLTYQKIAVKLGVSERTVKKYMAKAMLQCVLIEARFNDAEIL